MTRGALREVASQERCSGPVPPFYRPGSRPPGRTTPTRRRPSAWTPGAAPRASGCGRSPDESRPWPLVVAVAAGLVVHQLAVRRWGDARGGGCRFAGGGRLAVEERAELLD